MRRATGIAPVVAIVVVVAFVVVAVAVWFTVLKERPLAYIEVKGVRGNYAVLNDELEICIKGYGEGVGGPFLIKIFVDDKEIDSIGNRTAGSCTPYTVDRPGVWRIELYLDGQKIRGASYAFRALMSNYELELIREQLKEIKYNRMAIGVNIAVSIANTAIGIYTLKKKS